MASQNGHLEVVQALLAKGAEVNARVNDGSTALGVASQNGHLEVVRALLAEGADVNVKGGITLYAVSPDLKEAQAMQGQAWAEADESGATPLSMAKANGHDDVVELLRQHGGHE